MVCSLCWPQVPHLGKGPQLTPVVNRQTPLMPSSRCRTMFSVLGAQGAEWSPRWTASASLIARWPGAPIDGSKLGT